MNTIKQLFARDSIVWTFGIIAAFFTFLAMKPVPTVWMYADWMQFAAFAIGTIAAALRSSPLLSKSEINNG